MEELISCYQDLKEYDEITRQSLAEVNEVKSDDVISDSLIQARLEFVSRELGDVPRSIDIRKSPTDGINFIQAMKNGAEWDDVLRRFISYIIVSDNEDELDTDLLKEAFELIINDSETYFKYIDIILPMIPEFDIFDFFITKEAENGFPFKNQIHQLFIFVIEKRDEKFLNYLIQRYLLSSMACGEICRSLVQSQKETVFPEIQFFVETYFRLTPHSRDGVITRMIINAMAYASNPRYPELLVFLRSDLVDFNLLYICEIADYQNHIPDLAIKSFLLEHLRNPESLFRNVGPAAAPETVYDEDNEDDKALDESELSSDDD